MLRRYRRWFAVLAALVVGAPPVVGLIAPDNPATVLKEGRRLAPAPRMPVEVRDWTTAPAEVDAYLRDHFGLRHAMIQLHRDLTRPMLGLGGSGPDVLIGRDGRMFYLAGETVRQSAGLVLREQKVADSANALARMRDALETRGIGFLVTVLPSSSTMYQGSLPIWAQSHGKTTEYDLFLQDLAARRVKTVDLRPALMAAASEGKAYLLHDAHWTPRGAIAGFNALVEADSHPDWRVDPATALGPPTEWKGGDLARMIGEQDNVTETVEPFALPPVGKDENLSEGVMPSHVVTTGNPGPTILIVGDSFTFRYFPAMLAPHVGRAIWVHYYYSGCDFDWTVIDRFHPDEVWWARVERVLICESDVQSAPGAELHDRAPFRVGDRR
jgi:alginate O-acetyltransferase complex protein AlgJ